MNLYLTAAGVYAGTQIEAKRDGKGWHAEIVPTDKTGLIDYLNKLKFGDCASMVEMQPQLITDEPTVIENMREAEEVRAPSHLGQSIAFDDAFEAMPLAQKLHFAALAMEAAREELK